jgi:hypothetical protein
MLGFWQLGTTATAPVPITDGAGSPADPPANPTYRVYGEGALMANGTGSLSKLDTGAVAGASNASPIVITSAGHGLQTGTRVTVAGVLSNTAANGTFTVSRIDADRFSLDGSAGNADYTAGGTWHVSGLYQLALPLNGGDGYEEGKVYHVLVTYTLSGQSRTVELTLMVV